MDKGRAQEPDESPKSMHESSDREDGSDEETSFEEPSPLRIPCAKRQRVEIPDPDYNLNDELKVAPRCSARRLFNEEETIVPSEDTVAPTSSNTEKQKRGQRKMNKLHTRVSPVTTIDKDEAPIEPAGINTNWRNDCGVLVRRKINVTYDSWPEVPNNDKKTLWNSLSAIYRFPPELYERCKAATLKTMGSSYRIKCQNWFSL
ncbi:hypothetical protein C2845_PM13G09400 [Panicum miliaceum]|uniref:Uncharacterized protein n=1 Tax=Panicum miliaceum TaxID=4540 RepID=A0A3L6RIT1_PANMI|nr:hypothetical protein C2845_PM13G09400 [Panicum miliaceum]